MNGTKIMYRGNLRILNTRNNSIFNPIKTKLINKSEYIIHMQICINSFSGL